MTWLWWAPLGAATLHIGEEFVFPGGFPEWDRMYRPQIRKSITKRFHIVINALLIGFCLTVAQAAGTAQGVAAWLTLAALLLGNAIFHLVGTVKTRRYSPGLVTGLALYVPMAIVGYVHFLRTRQASWGTAAVAALLGSSYQLWATMLHARRAAALVVLALLVTVACGLKRSDEVSFEFPHNQIVVEASLQGDRPHACLLDTGTNPSAVDAKLAAQLGLVVSGPGGKAEGVGTEEITVQPTTVEVAVGGSEPARIDALTIDLGAISRRIGRPIECILGQSWLTSRVVQIDYPRRVVRFSKTALAAKGGTCEETPMRYWVPDDAMPLVRVHVQGIDYPVTLDTGSSGTLRLFGAGPGGSSKTVAGFRGEATVTTARVATFAFGPLSLKDLEITYGDRNQGEPADARQGNLGNGVLQHLVLTLDYPGRRMTVCTGGAS